MQKERAYHRFSVLSWFFAMISEMLVRVDIDGRTTS